MSLSSSNRKRTPGGLVRELADLRMRFGDADASARKTELLDAIAHLRLRSKRDLVLLHESLLFLRAYPDSDEVMRAAEEGLRSFARRVRDLGRGKGAAFDETGIAGSAIHCAFSLPVVRDLAARHPGSVSLFSGRRDLDAKLGEALFHLLSPGELEAYLDGYISAFDWLTRSAGGKGRALLPRFLALLDAAASSPASRGAIWAALDLPIRWDLGEEDGSRTLARAPSGETSLQVRSFGRDRVDLRREAGRAPRPARRAKLGESIPWINAARSSAASRLREMYTFMHASADDLWVAPLDGGLEIGFFGVVPEARLPLRTFYGYLLARNGVPIGYGDAVLCFGWGELNFHIYDTFRQAESSRVYASIVRLFHHHFGLSYLFLNRYQFGHRNEDAIRSGAFWFYAKLGFRPRAKETVALFERERRRIEADPKHRTSVEELRALATDHMALVLGPKSLERLFADFHPAKLGLLVSRRIEVEAAGDRRAFSLRALRRIEGWLATSFRGAEQEALERLAPLIDCAPDLEEWSADEARSVVDLVRAKAASSELEFLRAMQKHRRLRRVLVTLGRTGGIESTMRVE